MGFKDDPTDDGSEAYCWGGRRGPTPSPFPEGTRARHGQIHSHLNKTPLSSCMGQTRVKPPRISTQQTLGSCVHSFIFHAFEPNAFKLEPSQALCEQASSGLQRLGNLS